MKEQEARANLGLPTTLGNVHCGMCGNAYLNSRIVSHLKSVHNYTGDEANKYVNRELKAMLELPINDCTHPEGVPCPCGVDFLMPEQPVAKLVAEAVATDATIAELDDFTSWWRTLVNLEAPVIARKAKEYGSNSLAEMGRLYARGQGREVTDAEALELGCDVYAYGKMQRVGDAMIKGTLPSTDTIKDTMIYMAMALYIRANGRWP